MEGMFDDLPAALGCLAVLCVLAGAALMKVIELILDHVRIGWH